MATQAVPHFDPLVPLDQDDLLDLFDRLLPDFYLAPLKEPGPGYEYLQAVAKMNARVSEAVAHIGTGCYIGSATGGSYASAQVEFYRDNVLYGAVTLRQGTVVGTVDGYYYQTTADVVFGALEYGPKTVTVQALARGWNWNKPGPSLTKAGDILPGSITRLISPVVVGSNFDPTLQVRQKTDATGGSSPMLDGLGEDRGLNRSIAYATVQLTRTNTYPTAVLPGSRLKTADGFLYRVVDTIKFERNALGPYTVRAVPLIQASQSIIDSHGLIAAGTAGVEIVRTGGLQPDATLSVVGGSQTAYIKESDDSYRARIAFLPETITPVSLAALIEQIIGQTLRIAGEGWSYREVWDIRYQTAYSETSTGSGPLNFPVNQTFNTAEINVVVPDYSSNIFVYDYGTAVGDPGPLANRYLAGHGQAQIVFALPNLPTPQNVIYAGLAQSLEQAKPAGIDLAYILVP